MGAAVGGHDKVAAALLKAGRVVALDTTDNLLKRFASRALRVRLSAPIGLDFLPGARDAGHGWVEIPFESYGEVEDMLSRIRLTGGEVEDMVLGEPDLEKVFMGVMHEA